MNSQLKVCKVSGCDSYELHIKNNRTFRFGLSKGYCQTHYKRMVRHGSTENPVKVAKVKPECAVVDCKNESDSLGYCIKHYSRFKAWGSPYTVKTKNWAYKVADGKRNTEHPLYGVWCSMHQRCVDKNNKAYKHYGGRGIKVCESWSGRQGFKNFVTDMGERPKGYTIDRIDVNGNYEPSNCKWASMHEQNANKQNSNEHVGVHKFQKGWRAAIKVNGKHYKKLFRTIEDAIKQRKEWEKELL